MSDSIDRDYARLMQSDEAADIAALLEVSAARREELLMWDVARLQRQVRRTRFAFLMASGISALLGVAVWALVWRLVAR